MSRDIYQAITDRFIERLKQGVVPWQQPWFCASNVVSQKPYRGINALLLGSSDFKSPFWVSFKQCADLGGHLKKGAESTPVVYYKFLEKRDAAGNVELRSGGVPRKIPFIRWSNDIPQSFGRSPEELDSTAFDVSSCGALCLPSAFRELDGCVWPHGNAMNTRILKHEPRRS